jgi:hypothetical protein
MLWAPASARATWIACKRTPVLSIHMLNAAQFHSTGTPSSVTSWEGLLLTRMVDNVV